jgi:hypothetical protein
MGWTSVLVGWAKRKEGRMVSRNYDDRHSKNFILAMRPNFEMGGNLSTTSSIIHLR